MRKPRIRLAALSAVMSAKGFNSRSLSAATGINEASISKILNLRVEAAPESRRRIAAALGVPQRSIFGVTQ